MTTTTTAYVATIGSDIVAINDSLAGILDWLGDIHEDGDSIAIWQGSALLVVIDGRGHTIHLNPEGRL
jgi:hypothetical protein